MHSGLPVVSMMPGRLFLGTALVGGMVSGKLRRLARGHAVQVGHFVVVWRLLRLRRWRLVVRLTIVTTVTPTGGT